MTAEGLTEAERTTITDCDCGHDIGGEHNGFGCYGVVTYGPPIVHCGCQETDDREAVNYTAVERILAARLAAVQAERDAAEAAVRCQHVALSALEAERDALRERVATVANQLAAQYEKAADVGAPLGFGRTVSGLGDACHDLRAALDADR